MPAAGALLSAPSSAELSLYILHLAHARAHTQCCIILYTTHPPDTQFPLALERPDPNLTTSCQLPCHAWGQPWQAAHPRSLSQALSRAHLPNCWPWPWPCPCGQQLPCQQARRFCRLSCQPLLPAWQNLQPCWQACPCWRWPGRQPERCLGSWAGLKRQPWLSCAWARPRGRGGGWALLKAAISCLGTLKASAKAARGPSGMSSSPCEVVMMLLGHIKAPLQRREMELVVCLGMLLCRTMAPGESAAARSHQCIRANWDTLKSVSLKSCPACSSTGARTSWAAGNVRKLLDLVPMEQ